MSFRAGHTMMTLVLMALGIKYRLTSRHFILVNGILLIIATVYQRYHYVRRSYGRGTVCRCLPVHRTQSVSVSPGQSSDHG